MARYALIDGVGRVHNMAVADAPLGPDWIAAGPHVRIGDVWDGGEFRPAAAAAAEPVPESVTRLQARLALIDAGRWADVEAWAADPARTDVERAYWADSPIWRRADPVLAAAAAALGMDSDAVDALFRAAATAH
jgi:hypothetical protein